MELKEILKLTYNEKQKMNTKEVDEVLNVLLKNTNRKISEMKKKGTYDENTYIKNALKDKQMDKKGNLTADGLTLNEKKKLTNDLIKINKAKQGTSKGYEKVQRQISKRIGANYEDLSEEDKKRLWDIYNRFKERHPNIFLYDETYGKSKKEKANEIQGEIVKRLGILKTTRGTSRKIWNDRMRQKAVDKLEEQLGLSKSEFDKSEIGKKKKAEIMKSIEEGEIFDFS